MAAFGRCARCFFSRAPQLQKTIVFTQATRNIKLLSVKQKNTTLFHTIRRAYAAGPMHDKTRQVEQKVNPLEIMEDFLNRYGNVNEYNVKAVFQYLKKSGMENIQDCMLLLRCTGSPLKELHPDKRLEYTDLVWEAVQGCDHPMRASYFNNLLLVYLENQKKFSAPDFLISMEKAGVKPNRITLQLLISAYCEDGDVNKASQLLQHMQETGVPVTDAVYNSLVLGHFRANDEAGALNMVELMKESGLRPTTTTYSMLLQGYAEKDDMESFEKVMNELESEEVVLKTRHLFDSLFMAVMNGHDGMALQILQMAKQKHRNVFLDLRSTICQLVCHGHVEIALKMYDDNFDDSKVLKDVINATIKNLDLKKYGDIVLERCQDADMIKIATDVAFRSGRIDWALLLQQKSEELGVSLGRDPHLFRKAFIKYKHENNREGVIKTIQMEAKNIKSPNALYSTINYWLVPMSTEKLFDDIIEELRTDEELDVLLDYMKLFSLLKSDLPKALELVKEKKFKYNWQIPVFLRKDADLKNHWKECLQILKLCHVDNLNDLSGILKQIFTLNPESAEDIVKEIGSLKLFYTGYVRLREITDLLKLTGLEGKVSQDVIQAATQVESDRSSVDFEKEIMKNLQKSCRQGRIRDAEQALMELRRSSKQKLSSEVYRNLLVLYSTKNYLPTALKYLQKLEEEYPSYTGHLIPLLDTCRLLIEDGKSSDVIPHLTAYKEKLDAIESKTDIHVTLGAIERLGMTIGSHMTPGEGLDFIKQLAELSIFQPNDIDLLRDWMIRGCIDRGDPELIMEALNDICERNLKKLRSSLMDIMTYYVKKEDSQELQKVVDKVHKFIGEMPSFMLLIVSLALENKMQQAQHFARTPGLRADRPFLHHICIRLIRAKKINELERLVDVTKNIFLCDRKDMLFSLMKGYLSVKNFKSAEEVLLMFDEEGIVPSSETLQYLASQLKANRQEGDFNVPENQHKKTTVKGSPEDQTDTTTDKAVSTV